MGRVVCLAEVYPVSVVSLSAWLIHYQMFLFIYHWLLHETIMCQFNCGLFIINFLCINWLFFKIWWSV